jgi:predicted nucleic acid-binding protein
VSLIVLDASVAVKWFLPEAHETLTIEAKALLNSYGNSEVEFIVPDLFWVEFAGVLWKAIRRDHYPKPSAEAALLSLTQFNFPTFPSLNLLDKASQIATGFDRTVYDSLYVALAEQTKSQFITADEKLANSFAAYFPVRWLGAI